MASWRKVGLSCVVCACVLLRLIYLYSQTSNTSPIGKRLTSQNFEIVTTFPQNLTRVIGACMILEGNFATGRHLLANTTEAAHGPEWEQCDYELAHGKYAWVVSHAIGILIIFIGNVKTKSMVHGQKYVNVLSTTIIVCF